MKTILLVDDEPALRRLVELTLGSSSRYRILHAGDGAAALETIERNHVDLVLLDVGMPGLDGFAVCERLRARPVGQRPRIAMLTARAGAADRERGRALGADMYLAKPFSPIALLDCVARLMQGESAAA